MNPMSFAEGVGVLGSLGVLIVAIFISWLWYLRKDDSIEKDNNCALADSKMQAYKDMVESFMSRQQEIEEKMIKQSDLLIKVVEDNAKANAILAERIYAK